MVSYQASHTKTWEPLHIAHPVLKSVPGLKVSAKTCLILWTTAGCSLLFPVDMRWLHSRNSGQGIIYRILTSFVGLLWWTAIKMTCHFYAFKIMPLWKNRCDRFHEFVPAIYFEKRIYYVVNWCCFEIATYSFTFGEKLNMFGSFILWWYLSACNENEVIVCKQHSCV